MYLYTEYQYFYIKKLSWKVFNIVKISLEWLWVYEAVIRDIQFIVLNFQIILFTSLIPKDPFNLSKDLFFMNCEYNLTFKGSADHNKTVI